MPNDNQPAADNEKIRTAQATIKLREYELWFLLRARQIQNKAGARRLRLEIEVTADRYEIINIIELNPDLGPV